MRYLIALLLVGAATRPEPKQVLFEAHESDLRLEFRVTSFDGSTLKGRAAVSSGTTGLRLEPGQIYCDGLFQIIEILTCDGRLLEYVRPDCIGGLQSPKPPVTVPAGMWLGSDETWSVAGELPERCVDVTIQVFLDGNSRKRPGPRLTIRAVNDRVPSTRQNR